MRDGVRSHHEFEAMNTRQEVVVDICGPAAFLSVLDKPLIDKAYHCADECPRADCGIQHLDFMPSVWQLGCIREAVREAEIRLEYMVHGANDEAHDRKRRIVRAHLLTQFGVVFFQEIFVEVNDRVLPDRRSVLFEILLHQLADIRTCEYLTKFVYD